MKGHIICRIEPSPIIAVKHWGRFEGTRSGHHDQATWRIAISLGAEEDAIFSLVIDAAIWHKRLAAWDRFSSPGAILASLEQTDDYG